MKKKRKEKNVYSTVSLPSPLVKKIKKTIKNTGYVSVSDFVTDVLRTVLAFKNLEEDNKNFLSESNKKMIKQRLNSLGYLK